MSATEPAVRIYCLRPFRIEVGSAPLQFSRKAPRKPLELLKTLIALGGERVPIETLADALWPEGEGDQTARSFNTTVYRLRRRLPPNALVVQDARLSLDPVQCWCDCVALRHTLARVRHAVREGDARGAGDAVEAALELYQAPFLDGEYEPPEILSTRETLHAAWLRHVAEAGQFLEHRGETGQALRLYARAVEVDPVAEELVQALLRCCADQGRAAEGLVTHERLRELLRARYGVAPAAATEAAAAQLRAAAAGPPVGAAPAGTAPHGEGVSPMGPAREAPAHPEPPDGPSPVERRRVAVLCIEAVRGGAGNGADAEDPESRQAHWQGLRADIEAAVARHGGMVNQVTGQRVTAVFGLPAAHEDDPLRAVRAARAVLHPGTDGERRLGLRAAVESGLVVTGAGGPDEGRFAVAGAPLDAASALLPRARADGLIVGTTAYRTVGQMLRTRPVRNGRALAGYHVLGEATDVAGPMPATRQGLTPFTGRADALRQLHRALADTLAGAGQLVTVSGEAGRGKSRLVAEFLAGLDTGAVTVREGRCHAYGTATPYHPFLDAIRRALLDEPEAPPETQRERLVERVLSLEPALEAHLPFYLHLLSLPAGEQPLPGHLQGDALRHAFEEALGAGFAALARQRPSVLVLEDWHWADEASEGALRHLAGLVPALPLLLVVLYRPEYVPEWLPPAGQLPLVLEPLVAEEVAAMLAHLWETGTVPDELAGRIARQTAGNPYFVEELGRALDEAGTVQRRADGSMALPEGEALQLPETVEATLRARVDRLAPGPRETLRRAAVLGRHFERRLLAAIHPAPQRLVADLDRLIAAGLVQPTAVLPEPAYRFRHDLAQATVYDSLLLSQRRELHGTVGAAIERLYAGQLEAHYESLAHHFSRSADTDKAIDYLEKAGDKARASFAMTTARTYYGLAIEQLRHRPSHPDADRRFVSVAIKWARLSTGLPSEDMLHALEEAQARAEAVGDREALYLAKSLCAYISFLFNRNEQAQAEAKAVIRAAPGLSEQESAGIARMTLGTLCYWGTAYAEAINYLTDAVPALRAETSRFYEGLASAHLGLAYAMTGDFAGARAAFEQAQDIAERSGLRFLQSWVTYWTGYHHAMRGQWPEAMRLCEAGAALAEEIGDPWTHAWATTVRGHVAVAAGNGADGLATMARGVAALEATGVPLVMSFAYGTYAEGLALTGHAGEVMAQVDKALACRAQGDDYGQANALRATMVAAACRPRLDRAAAANAAEEAIGATRSRSAWPDEAVTRFRDAECLHKLGDAGAARAQIDEAEPLFAEMGMDWWTEQARALRARLDAGEPFRWFAPYVDGPPGR